jgi:hypothetical protein
MIIQKMDISSPLQSEVTGNRRVTRYGRVSKPPVRYEPIEQVEDDYAPEDYDSVEISDVASEIRTGSDEEDDETDTDEYGNLDGFVVPDKNESDDESTDGESSVSSKERGRPSPLGGRGRPSRVVPFTPAHRKSKLS